MKVTKLTIRSLFGSHKKLTINFNTDDSNITILHGPNGIGKTTILCLLNAALNGNLEYLYKSYFSSMEIVFTGNLILNIKKQQAAPLTTYEKEIPYILYEDNKKTIIKVRKSYKDFKPKTGSFIKDGTGGSWDINDDKKQYFFLYNSFLNNMSSPNEEQLTSYISELKKKISVRIINTNRLYLTSLDSIGELLTKDDSEEDNEDALKKYPQDTVLAFSKHLSEEIGYVKSQKEIESEKLDSSFPSRLLELANKSKKTKITLKELDEDFSRLMDLNEELRKSGLSVKEFDDSIIKQMIPSEMFPVIKLYFQDNMKKLSFYDDLLSKVRLFLDIINERNGFMNKKMNVSPEGLNFTSTINDTQIPLDRLSSGESHILILYYYLIFLCSSDNSVILIDEPEISMHISWQEEFINCLQDICKMRNMQAIVTTHSPNIVNGHMSLLRGLSEGK